MFRKKPAPDWIRGGYRFAMKTRQNRKLEPPFRFNRNGKRLRWRKHSCNSKRVPLPRVRSDGESSILAS